MKQVIIIIATIILAIYIGGTLINGSDATSMKSQIKNVRDAGNTKMTSISGW